MKKKGVTLKTSLKKRWFLYILRCANNTLYTGITNNLERRLKTHSEGRASRYTRVRLPVELVYHEPCRGRAQALIRECAVKSFSRPRKEKLILGGLRPGKKGKTHG